jgi:hypothetical protein
MYNNNSNNINNNNLMFPVTKLFMYVSVRGQIKS